MDKPIKLTRQMKILGVILDDRLNGLAHLDYLKVKTGKILNRLTVARSRKGLSGRVLKILYKRALERIIVYAAPAWWAGSVNQRNKIITLQRQVLLAVTEAFRTTSTAALHVLSGIEPVDQVCDMETEIYKAKQGQQISTFLGRDIEPISLDAYVDQWQHPAEISDVRMDPFPSSSSLAIYTDGSKMNNRVGAAFCVLEPELSSEYLYRLADHNTVFQAELTALHQALLWKKQQRPRDLCNIFTDSLSSLKAIQKLRPRNNLVEKIKDLCDETVSLQWGQGPHRHCRE
ncbi:hypothetical protein AVEN_21560-1 [Araneus ventricosus]|uniref:RNase H type-1 domain-containing protein n=1 Tax=Araneus ventricosus TaxID=182803 RepID=A0A4Y2MNE2_ARAVE|nr:hypothetical protein AVEN_21560-1 [Araneus ventricosus]